MKIKLAILEKDQNYLNRIVSVFAARYADKFEIYSFTDLNVTIATLENTKIDVLLASDVFEIDTESLPKRCGFAYLVDSSDVDTVNGRTAICKFQKADLICKQILSVYSDNAGSISGLKLGDDSARIIAFQPISGGCGSSCAAAACALHFAEKDHRVLYLNLENFGSADSFFSGDGQFDMSDVIYAVKSKKANLAMKIESCVKKDQSGVSFFSQPKIALDIMEITPDDVIRLITEIKLTGAFDYIILDLDFSIGKDMLKMLSEAHAVVWVGDGSDISNAKLFRTFTALTAMEQNSDISILNRIALIYNKFSNKTGTVLENIEIKNIGGAPRYEHASTEQVLRQLAPMDMYDKIL